jgi:hypothetical protein
MFLGHDSFEITKPQLEERLKNQFADNHLKEDFRRRVPESEEVKVEFEKKGWNADRQRKRMKWKKEERMVEMVRILGMKVAERKSKRER